MGMNSLGAPQGPENLDELKQQILEEYKVNGLTDSLEDMFDRWQLERRDQVEQEILQISDEAKQRFAALAEEEGIKPTETERYIQEKQRESGANIKEDIVRTRLEIEIMKMQAAVGMDRDALIEAADALWEGSKKLGEEISHEVNDLINELEKL
jgi:hypothetical protein